MSEEICKNCKYHFIEEISFDYLQSCCNKENIIGTTEPLLHCKDFEYSKDYITNLQQENKQLKERLKNEEKVAQEYLKIEGKIDKAIDYIKLGKIFDNEDIRKVVDKIQNDLLKILGDKE